MSVLIFFAVLFILVLVHEWGHFIVAKKSGMRVDEFGIGFPPKLFGIKKGETEYTFNSLPIGGFVKIFGENSEEMLALEKDSKQVADLSRAFGSRPKWAQALVLIAGVAMNALFAWFLFTITLMIGVQMPIDETVATETSQMYITNVLPDSPAAALKPGSVIKSVSFDGQTSYNLTPTEFSAIIGEAGDNSVEVAYEYQGKEGLVSLQPAQGLLLAEPNRYAVGASLTMVDTVKKPFWSALVGGLEATINGLKAIVVGLYTLIAQAVVGEADFSQVAGPVGIVGMVGDAASFGLVSLLTFTAIISLNLAVINLLPFPALDGGRLVFVAIEAVTRKRIPAIWASRVNLIGFGILMLLMIVVTYNDIVRIL